MTPNEGLPHAWLFETLDGLRREMTDQHQRLRSDVTSGFSATSHEVKGVQSELTKMALDVNTLKTQRDIEEKYAAKRAAVAGLFAGFIFSVLVKLGEWLWHTK